MSLQIRVVVADDHDLFREGLVALIERDARIIVVGQANDGLETIRLVEELEVDVVLLDVEMPGPAAPAVMGRVRRASPSTKVIVLTMHRDAILAKELLGAGASGYFTKATPAADLISAIHGESTSSQRGSLRDPEGTGRRSLLTRRESRELQLMADAYSNQTIGAQLSISTGTVKRHANNIFRKLGATSRMDAVRRAERLGLLEPRPREDVVRDAQKNQRPED